MPASFPGSGHRDRHRWPAPAQAAAAGQLRAVGEGRRPADPARSDRAAGHGRSAACVQAAELRQRSCGGYPDGGRSGSTSPACTAATARPKPGGTGGTLDEALGVLLLVRPTLPRAVATAAMTGQSGDGFVAARAGGPGRWTRSLAAARVRLVTADSLVARSGALTRVAQVVPARPVQLVRLEKVRAGYSGPSAWPRWSSSPRPARSGRRGGAPSTCRTPHVCSTSRWSGRPAARVPCGNGPRGAGPLTRTRPVRMAMRVSSAPEGLPEMAEALAETART